MIRFDLYSIFLLVVCAGCGGPDATVQGTVTIDGQLAPHGTVIFHPVDDGPTAYGTIAENGSYAVRVGQGDRSDPNASQIYSGEYIVTAVVGSLLSVENESEEGAPPPPGPRLTAEKYANKDTSDLRVSVKPGLNVVPLELEGARPEEEEAADEAADAETSADAMKIESQETSDEPATDSADEATSEPVPQSDPSSDSAPKTEP